MRGQLGARAQLVQHQPHGQQLALVEELVVLDDVRSSSFWERVKMNVACVSNRKKVVFQEHQSRLKE